MMKDFETIVAIVILSIAAFPFFYLPIRTMVKARRARHWEKTDGIIIRADYKEFRRKSYGPPQYDLTLEYEYFVGEKIYQSNRIALNRVHPKQTSTILFKEKANVFRKKYPVGKKVKVYYDPVEPTEAVLDTRAFDNHLFLWLLIYFVAYSMFFLMIILQG